MKKDISMVLAAMMLLSLCSFAAAEDVVELEFVYHKTESNAIDAMETVINNFNAANPGIKVNFVQVPDTATVLQSRAQLNEMPDMFGCTTGNMFELMFEDGIIMDLTGQEFLSSVEPSSLEMSTYNGKNWRLPFYTNILNAIVPVQIWTIIGVGQYLIPVIVLLQIKVPPKSWAYLIIYPIFMYSWIPVNFLGFKDRHKMKWSHTLHTRALSYESAALLRKENKK